jgi:hypothetical protein
VSGLLGEEAPFLMDSATSLQFRLNYKHDARASGFGVNDSLACASSLYLSRKWRCPISGRSRWLMAVERSRMTLIAQAPKYATPAGKTLVFPLSATDGGALSAASPRTGSSCKYTPRPCEKGHEKGGHACLRI